MATDKTHADNPVVYIPMDRRHALVEGVEFSSRTQGAALFADISGFTPLTEALVRELGPQRGAEELTVFLNLVYDALINELHRFGGSAIAFAGDAITCWLDADSGLRATACALAMQEAMQQFAAVTTPSGRSVSLAMKAAVAVGPVRRFLVGDPNIRVIDALAGRTLERLAAAEHLAERGEVILDPVALEALASQVEVSEIRFDEEGARYGVVAALGASVEDKPWPPLASDALSDEQIRSWLLRPIYERLRRGMGEFLAELRPTVALFLRFGGIDFDEDDDAGKTLDAYIRWVQAIVAKYEGTLIDLNIGDKGAYLYVNFGAPLSHENNVARAGYAALELRQTPSQLSEIDQVQIGISQGRMRAGAYGGSMHRTYGVLGDEVNMSARLMMKALPGQILVSESAQRMAVNEFEWQDLPPMRVKGKSEPAVVFALRGVHDYMAGHLQQVRYSLPMVGRGKERALLEETLERVLSGSGQLAAITGEAGVGKSRLAAEVFQMAAERGAVGFSGACESYGVNTSYLVWHTVWRGILGVDHAWDAETLQRELEQKLNQVDPALAARIPLLSSVLNMPIPDNELTSTFDAKLRKTSLEALLVDYLRFAAQQGPIFVLLEDCQWLDPLSFDLLEETARAMANLPVFLVLAYRPMELERLLTGILFQFDYFTPITLEALTADQVEDLIWLKLGQGADRDREVPPELVERITSQAEGNPFYTEELLNYLSYHGIDPFDVEAVTHLELPSSLHSLVLSRIDQLTESQKITLKVASVIGRIFQAAWLWGVYPELGDPAEVCTDLEVIARQDLTVTESAEPELVYFFKQLVTQGVTYESLPYAIRTVLHDQIGAYIEQRYADSVTQYLPLLAYHYDLADNAAKKRIYLRMAGEAAQAEYANEAAIDYYQRVLPLLSVEEQIDILLNLGDVLQLVGKWQEAGAHFSEALGKAVAIDDKPRQGWSCVAMGELQRKHGQYADASEWLERGRVIFEGLDDAAGVGQVLHYVGTLGAQQGDYVAALQNYAQSLEIRRSLDDKRNIGSLLSNMGIVARFQGEYARARSLHEEALAIRRELGNKWAIANSLNNLGNVVLDQEDYDTARASLEEAVTLQRQVGDRWATANSLNNLANVARTQSDYASARAMYRESMEVNRDLGAKWAIAYLLEDIGVLAALLDQPESALKLCGAATHLREEIGSPRSPAESEKLLASMSVAVATMTPEAAVATEELGQEMSLDAAIAFALEVAHL